MDANEIQRQARNAVRKGSILDVDHKAALCRVAIGESDDDGLQTNWIPWLTPSAGATREWLPPTKGEQVVVLGAMGDLAQGVALRGVFSDAFPAPDHLPNTHTRVYADGARVSYDHDAHALTAELPAGATVRLVAPVSVTVETESAIVKAASVTLDAEQTTCTGALLVKGPLVFKSGMTGSGSAGGGHVMRIDGAADFTGEVRSMGKSLPFHTHQARGESAEVSPPL
ncbi:phage baseplate assembly protein V [Burkholderia thailandensis]|uniref:phage baseplate assembly protein V n=1 Tax=Burkholderia thailandensis TaxID=57975 RepID=UPI002D77970A|nr:phage baseplate assembly protein V [Burkholderia thailandensis]WRS65723.1 phage baseplate assembly protein V [Burkholderia thailandensis]